MRILHIAEAPGGVERYLVSLIKNMATFHEDEHILACSSAYDKVKFKDLVQNYIVIEHMHNELSPKNDLCAIFELRKIIRNYHPDIVYCHSSKAGAVGRIADIGFHNKVIYNAHGWSFNMKGISVRKAKFFTIVERMLAYVTDRIVCISEFEKKSALEHKICKEESIVVINNGIDFCEYKDVNRERRELLNIPNDAFVVGTTGRLAIQKAPDSFVKMAVEVKKIIPEAFFLMVGDGPERQSIEELINTYRIRDSFLLTGWVDDPLNYICCFDVAVLLSRWEGFGLVLPEYMIMNKPIVATNADAIPFVLADAGIIVDIDDYKAAAESVIRLYKDLGLRVCLVKRGKKRVQLFNIERTANEHEILFKEVLKDVHT